jgi:hypothetical protein
MSLSSQASLGALRLQTIQRAGMENNPAISIPEWNSYITNSYKELYDLLVSAYGNDYYVATPYQFQITGQNFYPVPSDFYKILGMDLQYSASPTGWITLKRFEFIDRNKGAYLNSAVTVSSLAQAWYIPEPTSLQILPTCGTTLNSTTVGVSDSTDLSVGMSIYGNGIVPGTTISSINTSNNTIVISAAAFITQPYVTLACWVDSTTIDGISGWEEYIFVDAAIKSGIKQEFDISELKVQKMMLKERIEAMAAGRDAGQAQHVSDAMAVNGFGYGLSNLGIANIRYRVTGNQFQFVTVDGASDNAYSTGMDWF